MMTDMSEDLVPNRRKMPMRDIIGLILLALNFGGMVWAAGRLSASIDFLREKVIEQGQVQLAEQQARIDMRIDYERRIAVLEFRANKAEKQ